MGLQLSIPDSILQAIRLPEQQIEQELLHQLAIALYSQGLLSFGKARELAQMDKYEFGQLKIEEDRPGSSLIRAAITTG
jgi:predicted HTH domain antitoxin